MTEMDSVTVLKNKIQGGSTVIIMLNLLLIWGIAENPGGAALHVCGVSLEVRAV